MALAWLIPNHYPPWKSFYNEAAMAVALGLLLIPFGRSLIAPAPGHPLSATVVALVATLPWLQFASGTLVYSGDALVASAYVASLAVAIHVGHAWASRSDRRLQLLLSWAALLAASTSSLIAVTQVFDAFSWGVWAELATPGMRAPGNLAQPNNMATLFGIGAVGAWYLFERGRLSAILTLVAVAALLIGGALTQSRVSLSFGVLAVATVWTMHRCGVVIRTPTKVVALCMLCYWLIMWLTPELVAVVMGDAPEDLATRGVASPRYQMWRMLLDAVHLVPWQGYGWLQVGAAELAVVDHYPPIKELWLQGHNVFLELVVWCGWPLGLLLGGMLLFWFFSRASRTRSLDAAAGMLVIGFIGLHALVEFPHHYLYFIIPAGLWAGIVEREEQARSTRGGMLVLVPALYVFATFGGIALDYPKMEDDFRLVRFESVRIVGAHATEKSPHAPFMSSLTGFLEFARTPPVAGMSAKELRAMEDATKRYPYAASLVRYATMLALNGEPRQARDTFVKIRYIYGDKMYLRLKNDVHDRVQSGETGLARLDADLPDVARLSP